MFRRKRLVIIIPTHRPNITPSDKISLIHLKKFLGNHDIFFVIPNNISAKGFKNLGFKVKKVNKNFFGTVRRYSNLLLTEKFYKDFNKYDFMLIYQLDALVFSDKIDKWLNSGYDYIAAPWFRPIIGYLSHKKDYPASGGNGGFSLRNIKKSIKILDKVNKSAIRSSQSLFVRRLWFLLAVITGKSHQVWLKAPALDYPFFEDGFWALEGPKYDSTYRVPAFKIALQFAFERFPAKSFENNGKKLPFGCHAWEKYDKKFWEPYLMK